MDIMGGALTAVSGAVAGLCTEISWKSGCDTFAGAAALLFKTESGMTKTGASRCVKRSAPSGVAAVPCLSYQQPGGNWKASLTLASSARPEGKVGD